MGFRLASALVVSALLIASCGGQRQERVIVLALDGVDPHAVDLLLSEDRLPNFTRLRREGAYGRLRSQHPLLSPVVWTTVATGRPPHQHGIAHFVAVHQETGEQLPVTSGMRRVKALWNILSDMGRTVAVVGWWATWPPEQVRGVMVSDHLAYHFLLPRPGGRAESSSDVVFPATVASRIAPCVKEPGTLTPRDLQPFMAVLAGELTGPVDFFNPVSHFAWALAAAETHRCVGLQLWREERPSALMIYVEAVDSASHLFGHLFRATNLGGELAEQQRRYGGAVEAMYLHADRIVGDYLEAAGGEATLVVLSDHGFRLGVIPDDPSRTHDPRDVSDRLHTMDGILYLHGPLVRPRLRIEDADILDIAPTVLALLGVPAAGDMAGHVLSEALRVEAPARIPSYESASAPAATQVQRDENADPQALERLRSLGYIGGVSGWGGDSNLAAMHFEAGRYEEALAAYQRLVRGDPRNARLRASLAGVLGAMARYDEALEQLSVALELQPLNVEALHNRAVIHERRGDTASALADYRAALRFDPRYAPSQRALARLGVTGGAAPARTADEARALAMAEQAADAARRGRYREAMRLLDAAVALAPRQALILQYRSNVAYLMGDRAAAIAALEKGLALEPDNALFRENLRRLREQAPPPRR